GAASSHGAYPGLPATEGPGPLQTARASAPACCFDRSRPRPPMMNGGKQTSVIEMQAQERLLPPSARRDAVGKVSQQHHGNVRQGLVQRVVIVVIQQA